VRSLRRKLLLALGAAATTLVLGEIAARVVLPLIPDPPGTAWIRDPDCGFRLRPVEPGEVPEDDDAHVNALGFRDRNHDPAPPPDTPRVIGLGDSFVYGVVPVRDNFLRVAADTLAAAGRPVDMVLAGVPGWNGGNEAGWLAAAGLDLHPDLVVLNFFVGNDVTHLALGGRVIRGQLYPTTSPQPLRHWLRKSVLFLLFETQVLRPLRNRGAAPPDTTRPADDARVDAGYLRLVSQYVPVFRRDPDRRLEGLWEEAEGHLDRIDALCRGSGVPWVLVLIPDETQVDEDVRRQVLARLELHPRDYDFDGPQRRLAAWAAGRGVPVLDLLPVLREAHRREGRQYVPNDTHWNEKGNRVAGRVLAGFLAPLIR